VILSVEVTVAYLVSSSNTVENTFTVGAVSITLKETTGTEYKMIPGATVAKDPAVTVLANSEACWLFVKLEKTGAFDTFCTYAIGDGWTELAGHHGVYYRQVEHSSENQVFPVLKNDSILIRDTLTEELLNTVTENPTLKLTAYAVQSDGMETAHIAWQILNP
jgi:hypothetical protein